MKALASALVMLSSQARALNAPVPPGVPAVVPAPPACGCSACGGDAYWGDPLIQVFVNGSKVGDNYGVSTLYGSGRSQEIDLSPTIASPITSVVVKFINDAYGGSPSMDRNVYVHDIWVMGATYGGDTGVNTANPHGTKLPAPTAPMYTNGTLTFTIQ